ncbi:MAG: hypothetical protein SFY81_11535 [Verrucomicrobiota bacterium]|nr:hypothetical protein [Verrucomicrobiota bacterium]
MFSGSFSFAARDWILPASVAAILILFLSAVTYWRVTGPFWVKVTCYFFRALGVLILTFCLLEPTINSSRPKPGSNHFAILVDTSEGMRIADNGQPRSNVVRNTLLTDSAWLKELEQTFQLQPFSFDVRLQPARDWNELMFDGRATAMGNALKSLAQRSKGQPLAGVLLLTDGNATDISGELPDFAGLPPVYPVLIGDESALNDLSLLETSVSQTAFEDAPVTIQANVKAAGLSGKSAIVRLIELGSGSSSNKVVAEEKRTIKSNDESLTFRFLARPLKTGLVFYRVETMLEGTEASEATLVNNSRSVVVDRGSGEHRVLYLSGRPNWEYKFLSRALSDDDKIHLVGLIRIARREPKFAFKGRAGESSNPLFRGFDRQDEETARYDQPVLIRMNTRDADELRGGFPKLPEDLFQYKAVILDDVEAGFFTADQQQLLQRFVSDRGGGLLMLGGPDSLQLGKYHRTPIGDMLPIYLHSEENMVPSSELRLALTREGWLQPWLRLRDNQNDERTRLETSAPFEIVNTVERIKPGALVLANAVDASNRSYPALAVQRFGAGRTAALAIGDFWRLGFGEEQAQADLGKAWRQMARWMVADVPEQIAVEAVPSNEAPGAMTLRVRARNKAYEPVESATINLRVEQVFPPSTNSLQLSAEPTQEDPDLFASQFISRDNGSFKVTAQVNDSNGALIGEAAAGWATDLAAEEFRSLQPNKALLESIARKTGGELLRVPDLPRFVKKLENSKAPIVESYTIAAWHNPLVFILALACFVAEWGLRRFKGMS